MTFGRSLHIITFLFFIAVFVAGCIFYDDYGGFTDELMEVETAAINCKYIAGKLTDNPSYPDVPGIDWQTLIDLPDYEDKTYGTAAMMPTLFVNKLSGVDLDRGDFLEFRRFYTFLNFYLTLICFYILLRMRFESVLTPLLGAVMLVLSPRIFAESFYNVKDIIFFCWFMNSMIGLGWYLLRRSRWGLFLFCLSFGLAVNARNFGIILLPAAICIALIDVLAIRDQRLSVKNKTRAWLLTLVGAVLCYLAITPYLWQDPIRELVDGLLFSSDQLDIGEAELFMGQFVRPRDYWYYIPLWIGITTPVLYLLCFLFKSILLGVDVYQHRLFTNVTAVYLFDLLAMGLFFVPLACIILSKAAVYHGWRQAYFLFAPLIYLAACGLDQLAALKLDAGKGRIIKDVCILAACGISFVFTGFWIVKNHPLDFVYFNPIGRAYASDFTRDYWGVASRRCIYDLLQEYDGREMLLGVNEDLTYGSAEISLLRFSAEQQHKIRVIWNTDNAEYLCFSYKNIPGNDHAIDGFEILKSYRVDGYDVAALYKRVSALE